MGSTNKSLETQHTAEAFLELIDEVRESDKPHLLAMILMRFDPDNQFDYGDYQFVPKWTNSRWEKALNGIDSAGLGRMLKTAIGDSHGNSLRVASEILETLGHLHGDEKVAAFAGIIFSGLCPFRFYQAPYAMDTQEFIKLVEESGVSKEITDILKGKVKFVSAPDQAFYLLNLIKDKPEKTQAAILGALLRVMEVKCQRRADKENALGNLGVLGLMMHMAPEA